MVDGMLGQCQNPSIEFPMQSNFSNISLLPMNDSYVVRRETNLVVKLQVQVIRNFTNIPFLNLTRSVLVYIEIQEILPVTK